MALTFMINDYRIESSSFYLLGDDLLACQHPDAYRW